eukprot:m.103232 g.103232  ORF g.103232 m.103232 type:complete len:244 (-) comp27484_c0_seq1:299-1030(-)
MDETATRSDEDQHQDNGDDILADILGGQEEEADFDDFEEEETANKVEAPTSKGSPVSKRSPPQRSRSPARRDQSQNRNTNVAMDVDTNTTNQNRSRKQNQTEGRTRRRSRSPPHRAVRGKSPRPRSPRSPRGGDRRETTRRSSPGRGGPSRDDSGRGPRSDESNRRGGARYVQPTYLYSMALPTYKDPKLFFQRCFLRDVTCHRKPGICAKENTMPKKSPPQNPKTNFLSTKNKYTDQREESN